MFNLKIENIKTNEPLGFGTYGKVFPYKEGDDYNKSVVKEIVCASARQLNLTIQEIVLGFNQHHEFITPVTGFRICWLHNELKIYIKMPRMKRTLADLIEVHKKNGTYISLEDIIRYFYSLLSALIHLKNQNICHRDIKPKNILLDENDTVKLSDIGTAKYVLPDSLDDSDFITGTQGYMAPEIYKPTFDKKKKKQYFAADLWSLGITIVELCLISPKRIKYEFSYEQIKEIINDNLNNIINIYGYPYGKGLSDILSKILDQDPENRIDYEKILHCLNEQGFLKNKSSAHLRFKKETDDSVPHSNTGLLPNSNGFSLNKDNKKSQKINEDKNEERNLKLTVNITPDMALEIEKTEQIKMSDLKRFHDSRQIAEEKHMNPVVLTSSETWDSINKSPIFCKGIVGMLGEDAHRTLNFSFSMLLESSHGTLENSAHFLRNTRRQWIDEDLLELYFQLHHQAQSLKEINLCHRDINPANIIISDDDKFKLTDYGLEQVFTYQGLQSLPPFGKPGFLSPGTVEAFSKRKVPCLIGEVALCSVEITVNYLPKRSERIEEIDELLSNNKDFQMPGRIKVFQELKQEYNREMFDKLSQHFLLQQKCQNLDMLIDFYLFDETAEIIKMKLTEPNTQEEAELLHYFVSKMSYQSGMDNLSFKSFKKVLQTGRCTPGISFYIIKSFEEQSAEVATEYHSIGTHEMVTRNSKETLQNYPYAEENFKITLEFSEVAMSNFLKSAEFLRALRFHIERLCFLIEIKLYQNSLITNQLYFNDTWQRNYMILLKDFELSSYYSRSLNWKRHKRKFNNLHKGRKKLENNMESVELTVPKTTHGKANNFLLSQNIRTGLFNEEIAMPLHMLKLLQLDLSAPWNSRVVKSNDSLTYKNRFYPKKTEEFDSLFRNGDRWLQAKIQFNNFETEKNNCHSLEDVGWTPMLGEELNMIELMDGKKWFINIQTSSARESQEQNLLRQWSNYAYVAS